MPNNAKINLVGNVTRDPEIRTVGNKTMVNMTVAANTTHKQPDGNYLSNFYDVEIWNPKVGEYVMEKIQKGTQVWVNGDLTATTYESKTGETRMSLRVNMSDIRALSRLKDNGSTVKPAAQKTPAPSNDEGEDLPF